MERLIQSREEVLGSFRYRFFDAVKPQFAPVRERGVSAPVSALADAKQPQKAIFSEP
jgi:hypothetical protein